MIIFLEGEFVFEYNIKAKDKKALNASTTTYPYSSADEI